MGTKKWKDDNPDRIRKYRRDWYARNKEHAKKKVYERRRELKEWFKSYRFTMRCEGCEESDQACLDFHHLDGVGKHGAVTKMVTDGSSRGKILNEISKCMVLCANCHRKLHYYERNEPYIKD